MKAGVYKEKGLLKVEEVPDPVPGPRDVVLKITHCAVCGSDLHRYSHGMNRPGTIMGHEFSGTVAAKGDEVDKFEIGDRVTRWGGKVIPGKDVFPFDARCNARERGFSPAVRPGAYAEYMATNCDLVEKIPDSVTNMNASLTEPLCVALHAVRHGRMRLGDQVLVQGMGPIGLFVLQCTALSGAQSIYVSEVNEARKAMAARLGATEIFDPRKVKVAEEIVRRTGIGVDVAIDCAGAHRTLQEALEAVRLSGKVVVLGLAWEPVYCLPVEWVGREVEVKTSYSQLPSEWPIAMSLLERKKVEAQSLISKVAPLDDIQEVFQELLKPTTSWIQAVIAFE